MVFVAPNLLGLLSVEYAHDVLLVRGGGCGSCGGEGINSLEKRKKGVSINWVVTFVLN